MKKLTWTVAAATLLVFASLALAQSPKEAQPGTQQKPAVTNSAPPEVPQDDVEKLKIDTNLVTVPVIASSRTGQYITDLRKEEFKLSEDGVPQEIAFLATVNAPFYVVLLLDTSESTQDSLPLIRRAAISFLNQLGPRDRVKIISFDSKVRDLNDFTSDKTILRGAIEKTVTGQGTRVYDAMQTALDMLRPIQQRKAIILFTDGVDWHSESSTFESTSRDLDESGIIVYPIRFETRAFTEQLARKQAQEQTGGPLPTSGILRQPPTGTTQTTFPSDDPFPVPAQKRSSLPIPPPSVLLGGGRYPNPPNSSPTDPFPDSGPQPSRRTLPDPENNRTNSDRRPNDSISGMLNNLYLMADSYLKEIAERSGGQVYRADNVGSLPQAFAAIADELRTQYLLGYYPINRDHDGSYRKIQVKTSRRDIAIRARPGYRARSGG
ncbi:MAG: Ca-activated chloride channel [Blastocatellia bacterium]|jgi:VWFA-related protein|nr:Ca-activated chloride channel [Blastocatellia bacterium]